MTSCFHNSLLRQLETFLLHYTMAYLKVNDGHAAGGQRDGGDASDKHAHLLFILPSPEKDQRMTGSGGSTVPAAQTGGRKRTEISFPVHDSGSNLDYLYQ